MRSSRISHGRTRLEKNMGKHWGQHTLDKEVEQGTREGDE